MMPTQIQSLRMERTFDAPPQQVWDAWTEPAQVAKWWNPAPGIDADVHELDLRVGGRLSLTMHVPDALADFGTDRFPVHGVFETLRPPHELVLRLVDDVPPGREMILTARFARAGARTRMTFEVRGPLAADELGMMEEGWGACFDNLADHLAGTRDVDR